MQIIDMSDDNIEELAETNIVEEAAVVEEADSEPLEEVNNEQKLEVDEELTIYMQQLNIAQLDVIGKIQKSCEAPIIRFMNDKFTILDGDKVFLQADWHFIGEFHTEKENPNIKGYEFVWSWGLKPDNDQDPHVREVTRVIESLPHGLQPLTFPLVQFEEPGIIEIIKAYSFHELNLECTQILFNEKFKSYGIFGLYNIEYTAIEKPAMLTKIVEEAKRKANELRKENPDLSGPDAIKQAWQSPEVLSLVAAHQREKQDRETAAAEFTDFFKRAIMNPSLVLDQPTGAPEVPKVDEKYAGALKAVERALDVVREEELADMEQVGDESE
jgi:hypothetical protein